MNAPPVVIAIDSPRIFPKYSHLSFLDVMGTLVSRKKGYTTLNGAPFVLFTLRTMVWPIYGPDKSTVEIELAAINRAIRVITTSEAGDIIDVKQAGLAAFGYTIEGTRERSVFWAARYVMNITAVAKGIKLQAQTEADIERFEDLEKTDQEEPW